MYGTETLEKLLKTLPAYNVQPLWTVMDAVVLSWHWYELIVGSSNAESESNTSSLEVHRH
jgi:hypothetical protein